MAFQIVEFSVLKVFKVPISEHENLRQAKIEQAKRERIEFWKSRGVDTK